MTICTLSLLTLFIIGIGLFLIRKPSKKEIKKFESEEQNHINWSRMGF